MKQFKAVTIRLFVALCLFGLPLVASPMMAGTAEAKKPQIQGLININTASPEQLRLLPRVGPKTALRIVRYRKKHKFAKPIDIVKVKGIGLKTFQKMKRYITVKKPTKVGVKK
ncbi:MAG: helix-hairpin-helix domain-containing protein [Deltaproteobacteria bacterium]|nr:MAG: helix-hairpin-helix domain-containing protein [Deltaproteobacteria bacterium]